MKPRARRITVGAAALAVVLLAVLVVANWSIVRDHVEAWHFQLTRETSAIEPDFARLKGSSWVDARSELFALQSVFDVLTSSGRSVIHDYPEDELHECSIAWPPHDATGINLFLAGRWWPPLEIKFTDGLATRLLRANGYRVLEQRFPRRAYIVIRGSDPTDADDPRSATPMG